MADNNFSQCENKTLSLLIQSGAMAVIYEYFISEQKEFGLIISKLTTKLI